LELWVLSSLGYVVPCLFLAAIMWCLPAFGENATSSVQTAVALLDAGDLPAAERLLKTSVHDATTAGHLVDEAVARKWLGVTLARSGTARTTEATNELWKAVALLEPLAVGSDATARSELGFALFDLSETLRGCAEISLREQRVGGLNPSAYFKLVHDFVSPAEDALGKASPFYPPDRAADLVYGRAELALILARLQFTFLPGSPMTESYDRAIGMFRDAIKAGQIQGVKARNDLIISATIRIAEIRQELAGQNANPTARQSAAALAVKELAGVQPLATDKAEIAGYLLYLKALCMMDAGGTNIAPDKAQMIEADLLKAADLVEDMRGKLAGQASFEVVGSFFSQRTYVYEALGRLYAGTHQAEKMLAAIERMKARAFRDILATSGGSVFDLHVLRQHLRQDKAGLVEFFYGPERAWAVWVPPDAPVEIIALPIDGQALVLEMRKVNREFANSRDRRGWMRMFNGNMRQGEMDVMKDGYHAANRLYELLLRPLEQRAQAAKVTRLYVVPHHVMNYLSFDALVTVVNETNLLASTFYVEHGMPLTCLPSATVLSDIGSSTGLTGGGKYVFARSDFHSIKPTFPADLEGTIPESKMVAEMTSASVFREAEASESRLKGLRGPFSLLYFATHGILDARHPLDSYILLAASDQDTASLDGRLTIRTLLTELRGKLQANLVVLSACHTNEGETSPASGDDLSALSRGFMVAGAHSVLATQWEASDDTFPKIMGNFLEAWAKQGQPKDEALASALRQFLAKNDFPVWRHPHFWGSVVLLGEAK
jgi:CHAT domain-containing protein